MTAVVVGGGIVGAACARALLREGFRVVLLEKQVLGGGATAAGMGHLVVMDDSEPQFQLTKYSRDLWDSLVEELPREVEYERTGTLWVAADEEELGFVAGKVSWYQQRGVAAVALDAKALRGAEPMLREGLAGGFVVSGDAVVYAPCAAAWLARGVERRVGVRVAAVGDGWVETADGERVAGDLVVVAGGAETVELFPQLRMKPRKGHLAITDRYPGAVRHQLVELGYLKSAHGNAAESVAFNIQPRKTGQLLIGSSRQYGAESGKVEEPLLRTMLLRAVEYMPGLRDMQVIRTWTGFRAATEDKLPAIGWVPGGSKTLLATGHEGLGITTSLGTAELVADLALGRESRIPREPYAVERLWTA